METAEKKVVALKFDKLNALVESNDFLVGLNTYLSSVKLAREKMFANATRWKNYIPTIQWYGGKNQYHLWPMSIAITMTQLVILSDIRMVHAIVCQIPNYYAYIGICSHHLIGKLDGRYKL